MVLFLLMSRCHDGWRFVYSVTVASLQFDSVCVQMARLVTILVVRLPLWCVAITVWYLANTWALVDNCVLFGLLFIVPMDVFWLSRMLRNLSQKQFTPQ